MTTTLSEGVKVPDVGSVNWAGDLEVNWNLLNGALANLSGNVKLDRDNTWTGEQSFTLPIIGSITGTASKAIADEDGTSIKTGYGKLANINTWSTAQVFLNALRFNNTSYVSGTPSENIFYASLQWGGYVNNTWSAPFTINNAIRTNGYSDTSFRTYSQTSNTLTGFVHETNADASDIAFRPIVNGTHKLGSSSYQWSSVYAQTYYYNGTAWGLDKANVWSGNNTYATIYLKYNLSGQHADLYWKDENDNVLCDFRHNEQSITLGKRYTGKTAWYQGAQIAINQNGTIELKSYNGTDNHDIVLYSEALYPVTTNDLNLGTSTNKWKSLNGVNPGALSLPNVSVSVAVDTTDWVYDGLTANLIKFNNAVQTFSGWLYITAQNTSANDRIVVRYIGSDASNLTFISGKFDGASSIFVACPIVAGVSTYVWSTKALNTIKIYKALGNV